MPWCSFANINDSHFMPGSTILLARGAAFTQEMLLNATGSEHNWVHVDAYGRGPKPIIQGDGSLDSRTMTITNPDYVRVADLEIYNAGQGIDTEYTTTGHVGLVFANLYCLDLNKWVQGQPAVPGTSNLPPSEQPYWSTSIIVNAAIGSLTPSEWVAKGVLIDGLRTQDATAPSFTGVTENVDASFEPRYPNSFQDITIQNSQLADSNGGMSFQGASNVTLESNFITGQGQDPKSSGQTSVFLWSVNHALVSDNAIVRTADPAGTPDKTAVDVEGYDSNISVDGNYISENPGVGIEVLALSGRPGDFNFNQAISGNALVDNNTDVDLAGASGGAFVAEGPGAANLQGVASDNLYWDTYPFSQISGTQWTETGTQKLASATAAYNNAFQLLAEDVTPPWSADLHAGRTYSPIQECATVVPACLTSLVSPFNMTTPTEDNASATRTWTAPRDGSVSIRSFIQTLGRNGGVKIWISENGKTIWPASGQPKVLLGENFGPDAVNLDSIAVNQGDQIRFELSATGPDNTTTVSWSPSIGYTG